MRKRGEVTDQDFFPRGFNADRKLCTSLSVLTEWKRWPYPDLWDQCLYICNTNIHSYIIISRRPGQDVKLSEEEGRRGVAGRARSSALQNFGIFPDNGMAYTSHRAKIAGYLSTAEILHTGMASQKPKLGGRRGRGVKSLIKLFSKRSFNAISIDVCFFLYPPRWSWCPWDLWLNSSGCIFVIQVYIHMLYLIIRRRLASASGLTQTSGSSDWPPLPKGRVLQRAGVHGLMVLRNLQLTESSDFAEMFRDEVSYTCVWFRFRVKHSLQLQHLGDLILRTCLVYDNIIS